jgi:hypothetical protein
MSIAAIPLPQFLQLLHDVRFLLRGENWKER